MQYVFQPESNQKQKLKKIGISQNTWKLNTTFLNNPQVKAKFSKEGKKKYIELNASEKKTYHICETQLQQWCDGNLWLTACNRKEEMFQINNLSSYCKKLEGE